MVSNLTAVVVVVVAVKAVKAVKAVVAAETADAGRTARWGLDSDSHGGPVHAAEVPDTAGCAEAGRVGVRDVDATAPPPTLFLLGLALPPVMLLLPPPLTPPPLPPASRARSSFAPPLPKVTLDLVG